MLGMNFTHTAYTFNYNSQHPLHEEVVQQPPIDLYLLSNGDGLARLVCLSKSGLRCESRVVVVVYCAQQSAGRCSTHIKAVYTIESTISCLTWTHPLFAERNTRAYGPPQTPGLGSPAYPHHAHSMQDRPAQHCKLASHGRETQRLK